MKNRSTVYLLLVLSMIFSALFPSFQIKKVEAADVCQIGTAENIVVVRVYYNDMKDIELLSIFDLFEFNNLEEKYVLVAIEESEISRIEKLGFKVEIDKFETDQLYLGEELKEASLMGIPGYTCYRTVEETFSAAQQLANTYSTLATWIDVGDSWEKSVGQSDGYDMMVMKITNQAIQIEKPRLFIIASIHAREYTPAELALRYAEHLLNNYGTDADITWIINYHEIHIMFQANPDGRKEAESGLSWRKNTNENYCGVTSNNRGADLNRNFSYEWGGVGASTNPCDATYRGPAPDSEPETRAIRDYMLSLFPDQRDGGAAPDDTTGIFLDLHTYGQYVLWPWGYSDNTTPNDAQLQTLGRKFAYFNGYRPGQTGQDLYNCSGVTNDFAYGELGIAAYTFEMGTAFFQSCTTFENTIYPTNLPALIYAAKVVRTPYMTPLGPDALSLSLSDSDVYAGETPTLTASINDTRFNNNYGNEPVQSISQAEYYIDTPPWLPGAVAIPMTATDGSFNSNIENVAATISTSGLSQGRHTLFVRGLDQAGNWGAFSAIFLTVEYSDNNPPVADDLTLTLDEDSSRGVTLTGSDPDGDPITFTVVASPGHGQLTGTAPELIYTPDADYNGTDTFRYIANDGMMNSPEATVSITIDPVGDAPVADPQSVTTMFNQGVAITLTGSDVDGDALYFLLVDEPGNGSISGLEPNIVYTPDPGFVGVDTFTFKANDGLMDSNYATVAVTVAPPGPVSIFFDDFETDLGWTRNPNGSDTATTGLWERANPQQTDSSGPKQLGTTVSGSYDLVTGPLAGSSVGSYDIDGGVTSIRSPQIALPANSQLTLSFWYYLAHLNNSSTADYLRVRVLGNDTVQVFEELGANNDDDAVWEDFSVDISQFAGQTIQIDIAAADASSGSLVEAAIDDVLIEGNVTNTSPVADEQSVETAEDTAVSITLTGSDPDGESLSFTVINPPIHGTLTGTAPDLLYTPWSNYFGDDTFTFVVNDGMSNSLEAVVDINVTPVNDAPVAGENLNLVLDEDGTISFTLPVSDVDNDILTLVVKENLSHGALSGDLANLTYIPDPEFFGEDGFSYTVSDGVAESNEAQMIFTVNSVNDKPIAYDDRLLLPEDYQIKFSLEGFDADSDSLTYTILTAPLHGELIGEGSSYRFVTESNYFGSDSFTFKVNDGQLDSDPAIVTITITSENDEPVAIPQILSTQKNTPLEITLLGEDVDEEPLTYAVIVDPLHGTLTGEAPNLTYTPATDFIGVDVFTFRVYDSQYWNSEAEVSITVFEGGNTPPVATPRNLSILEDEARSLTLTGTDADGDPLTFSISTQPQYGTLTGELPNLVYVPQQDYFGTDSFTFTATDGIDISDAATVSIAIESVNDKPVADGQSLVTQVNRPIEIELTGEDIEGSPVNMLIVDEPLNGTLSGLEPNLIYTPDEGWTGTDTFTFKVNDGLMDSDPATIEIVVEPVVPFQVFFDDFESDLGWIFNPFNTDTATTGILERADPESTYYYGYKQLGYTVSGTNALVTGSLAGGSVGANDVDRGSTSVRSPLILLPNNHNLTLSFSYYFAHASNSSYADYLRVKVVGAQATQILEELGAANDDDARWQKFSYDLSGFAGQTVYLLIQVADTSTESLVESAIDDVLIIAH